MQVYYIIGIIVMALVSFLPRVLPIILIKEKLKSPFIRSFLYYVPYAVLAAMIFPQILYANSNIAVSLAGFAVAVLSAYLGGGLIVAAVCSVGVVLLAGYFI